MGHHPLPEYIHHSAQRIEQGDGWDGPKYDLIPRLPAHFNALDSEGDGWDGPKYDSVFQPGDQRWSATHQQHEDAGTDQHHARIAGQHGQRGANRRPPQGCPLTALEEGRQLHQGEERKQDEERLVHDG